MGYIYILYIYHQLDSIHTKTWELQFEVAT